MSDVLRLASGVRGFNSGGNLNNGANAGMFYSNLNNAPSNTNWNYGASQSYEAAKPQAKYKDENFQLNVSPFPPAKAGKSGVKSTGKYGAIHNARELIGKGGGR